MQKKFKKNNTPDRCLKRRIREGDTVMVMSGADKGRSGQVLACKGPQVVVQGVNFKKKHIKPSEGKPSGGTIELEKAIHISNVRICTTGGKPVKLKVREKDGARELYYLDGDNTVAHRVINQKQR
jgi:large subunit ribosomal protein L24